MHVCMYVYECVYVCICACVCARRLFHRQKCSAAQYWGISIETKMETEARENKIGTRLQYGSLCVSLL
jgi:hypothetical protein